MGFPQNHFSLIFPLFLSLITISHLNSFSTSSSDLSTLIYKGCSDQKFQDQTGTINLKTLLSSLVSQSSHQTFFKTTYGSSQTAITGLYQCRGDLTTAQCSNCVGKIPNMAYKLCENAIAARIQLSGCYLRYEIVGFKEVSMTELLYKVCGKIQAVGSDGFEERRENGFGMVENGIESNGGLFYTGSYESVYVLGQCEGDLGSDECGNCVKNALESVKTECGDSISGQIYLHKCYISYSYYPNGVPNLSSSSSGSPHKTQRTVAIAVGGVAALGFVIVCLLFAKSVMKKRGGTKHGAY